MTNEEFKNKWGGVEADRLNEKDFAAFKNDCFLLYESNGWKDRFHSPYESEHENNGKPFTVLRRATADECDIEQMPCWRIRFDDGKETFAFPEEICKDEKKAFAEKATQNNCRGAKNDEYAPYQVRERNVL